MEFNITKEVTPIITDRVQKVITDFDLNLEHIDEHFDGNIDIEGKDWNIGLIVGGSGTGKSTIAKELFKDNYVESFDYSAPSILDDMPLNKTMEEIEFAFVRVGFSSPPSWLKPYSVLSNGEKMRVDLARALLEDKEMVVFDEFTSVVNREVAKTASFAISKAIKFENRKFVAVSCHKDIIDWLEPDWIYDTDTKSFFGLRGESTAPQSTLKYTGLITSIKDKYGTYLGNITI